MWLVQMVGDFGILSKEVVSDFISNFGANKSFEECHQDIVLHFYVRT
jgi:hypothetical protein